MCLGALQGEHSLKVARSARIPPEWTWIPVLTACVRESAPPSSDALIHRTTFPVQTAHDVSPVPCAGVSCSHRACAVHVVRVDVCGQRWRHGGTARRMILRLLPSPFARADPRQDTGVPLLDLITVQPNTAPKLQWAHTDVGHIPFRTFNPEPPVPTLAMDLPPDIAFFAQPVGYCQLPKAQHFWDVQASS